jgi:hypothetical protein
MVPLLKLPLVLLAQTPPPPSGGCVIIFSSGSATVVLVGASLASTQTKPKVERKPRIILGENLAHNLSDLQTN